MLHESEQMRLMLVAIIIWLKRMGLYIVSAVPFILGLLAGMAVSIALWIVAAIKTGYEYGRW